MTGHLYVLGIGPVQDFIAAARRTRDLWFGSFILSEISKAAARNIAQSGGRLIFPDLDKEDSNLLPASSIHAYNVSNIILAELPGGIDPRELDRAVQESATGRWQEFAEIARKKAESIIDRDIWNAQIIDVLEYYSAWVEVEDIQKEYSIKRTKLMHLFSGRKALSNFKQNAISRPGVHKSSLDGARESVIIPHARYSRELEYQVRPANGELLCSVGMIKRLSGIPNEWISFPSISRVTIDSWIRNVILKSENGAAFLESIKQHCTGEWSFVSGTGTYYPDFPFDGQFFFPDRLDGMIREDVVKIKKDPGDEFTEKELEQLRKIKRRIPKDFGEPDPYVAMLIADGDRMGAALSSLSTADQHRAFSRKLADFSGKAREIIEKDYHGCLIYSGGDDVMALLPVDACLSAARDLHDDFSKISGDASLASLSKPTLSVGVVICHSLTPLEDIRLYAKAAEEDAKKPDRNGLAVHVYKRSGGDLIRVHEQWRDENHSLPGLDKRLIMYADLYKNERISDKAAYDIKKMADIYNPTMRRSSSVINEHATENYSGIMDDSFLKFIKDDLLVLLKRKRAQRGSQDVLKEDISGLLNQVTDVTSLTRLADELILARKIADHLPDTIMEGKR